uniref:Uncharacterized protein n=1 Tax=Chromera velia CCMP2878 TaxID=1169474 RepID=A0A0G4H1W4_9ALVE|eukprot:Cvel_24285.t1-p1 / transcript=Cvel_24285.t1 / gene=Cvel_24285 / organism=Chromera_velia_CCMP2878 / gene_product=hypothetical protein / transcript_product=hypothetical protein / location=Cvel_scaffold2605:18671-22201(+) / protein_length=1082 / sequence_SO=supercontig / SO=protein_coding / is_pseudo=false
MKFQKGSKEVTYLVRSQVLDLGSLWTFSGLSKQLLPLRKDTSDDGLGSVCFDAVSNREDLFKLVYHFFKVTDRSSSPPPPPPSSSSSSSSAAAAAAASSSSSSSILGTGGMPDLEDLCKMLQGRYPFLLVRVLENYPTMLRKVQCILGDRDEDSTSAGPLNGLQEDCLSTLSREEPVTITVEGTSRSAPLLVIVLALENLDSAEALLDASARVDVCEWWGQSPHINIAGRTPLHALLEFLQRAKQEGEGGIQKRERGLGLLRRLAKASREANCLRWELRVGGGGKTTTALGLACIYGDAEAVKVLREEGGAAAVNVRSLAFLAIGGWEEFFGDRRYLTPPPSSNERAEVVRALGEMGMVVNRARKIDGHTPLSLAVARTREAIVETLLDLGALSFPSCPHIIDPPASPTETQSLSSSPSSPPLSSSHPLPTVDEVSPLRLACEKQTPSLVRLLCEKGKANPNAPGKREKGGRAAHPVMAAVRSSSPSSDSSTAEVVTILHEFRADMNFPQSLEDDNHTPLTLAVSRGMIETSKALGSSGVHNAAARHTLPRNPVIEAMASSESATDLLSFLLERGADPNQLGLLEIFRKGEKGRERILVSPLQASLLTEQEDLLAIVKLLIHHGARCVPPPRTQSLRSPEPPASSEEVSRPSPPPVCQASALLLASSDKRTGHLSAKIPDLIRLLCSEGGGNPNLPGKGREGDTHGEELPLQAVLRLASEYDDALGSHYEERTKDPALVEDVVVPRLLALLICGANPNAVAGDGHSPLSLACSLGLEGAAELLLERGAKPRGVRAAGAKHRVPLVEAARRLCSPALLTRLLDRGADPNARGVVRLSKDLEVLASPLEVVMYECDQRVMDGYVGNVDEKKRKCTEEASQLLIDRGARADLPPAAAATVTSQTAGGGGEEIDRAVDAVRVPSARERQISPLVIACQVPFCDTLVRRLCKEAKANPNVRGDTFYDRRKFPLAVVLERYNLNRTVPKGSVELLKALIEAGADLYKQESWPRNLPRWLSRISDRDLLLQLIRAAPFGLIDFRGPNLLHYFLNEKPPWKEGVVALIERGVTVLERLEEKVAALMEGES